jgi:site-specific recombinase XerD
MPKITNEQYAKFRNKGEIQLLTLEELEQALNNVNGILGRHIKEGRALLICLYYTGARPIEVLQLKAMNIYKEGSYIKIEIPTAKKGVPRIISLPSRFKYVKELYVYAQSNFRERLLFYNYISNYKKNIDTRKGINVYEDKTAKLYHHVKKWFKGVRKGSLSPYFLRHNRFSSLANAGVSPQDIQFLKGGRTQQSVQPYLHLSRKKSEDLAKKIK